jgi:hypothetical protein
MRLSAAVSMSQVCVVVALYLYVCSTHSLNNKRQATANTLSFLCFFLRSYRPISEREKNVAGN